MFRLLARVIKMSSMMRVTTAAALIGAMATILAAIISIYPELRTKPKFSSDEFNVININKPESGAFTIDSLLVVEGVGINPQLENFVEFYVQRMGEEAIKQDGKIKFFSDNSWEYRYCFLAKDGGYDIWATFVNDQKKFKSNVIHINKVNKIKATDIEPGVPGIRINEIVQDGFISGTVFGLDPSEYHRYTVIVYVSTDAWYIHPYQSSSAEISVDGSWRIETIHREPSPSQIAALLVEKGTRMPRVALRLGSIKYLVLDTKAYPVRSIMRLSGTVIDPNLNPIDNAKITIVGRPEFSYSDSRGFFSLALPRGDIQNLRMIVMKNKFQRWEKQLELSRSNVIIEVRLIPIQQN